MAAAGRTWRFWVAYAAAWLPHATIYATIFFIAAGPSIPRAIFWTLCNVGSAALLGVVVLRLCDRLPWTPYGRARFFAVHVAAALTYATAWISFMMLLLSIEQSIAAGRWTPTAFAGAIVAWSVLLGVMIYATIASIAYVIQVSTRLREEEALRAKAELKILRAQLNPHFLFNTLHSLMALVRHDQRAAEDALERFGELLRYALKVGREEADESDDVSLDEEWAFVRNYLALEKLRLADRLEVEARIAPESLECAVPAFTLQPLVENAIKHAIAPEVRGGKVTIASHVDDGDVVIEVVDDGPGASPAAIEASPGFGLRAVRRRLELRYPGRAHFALSTEPGRGVAVRIRVPAERKTSPGSHG